MNFTDRIIVLLRTNFREADRMVCAYSLEHGRMSLRFPGVNKHNSRLKAISEPVTKSAARIYIRRNALVGCVTGGKIESVYPAVRADFAKMHMASHFCELFYRLTPEYSPNEEKFYLLENSLKELENSAVNQGFAPAFMLRLMQLSGYGLKDMPLMGIDEEFWHNMHTMPLGSLNFMADKDIVYLNKTRYICQRFLSKYLNYPLHTAGELELTTQIVIEEALAETALEPVTV